MVTHRLQIRSQPSHHCLSMPPPLIHLAGATRANSSLGGGSPTSTTATVAIPEAGAPPEVATTTVEDRLSCLRITGLMSTISTIEGEQNGVP
jgi:hypothetical protein